MTHKTNCTTKIGKYCDRLTPDDLRFLTKSILYLSERKIHLVFHESIYVDELKLGGYFEGNELHIAIRAKDWFWNFVHEFCHVLQYERKTPPSKAIKHKDYWYYEQHNSHGKTYKRTPKAFRNIRNLEVECERMACQLIRKNKLSIPLDRYRKLANSYISGYWYEQNNKAYMPKLSTLVHHHSFPSHRISGYHNGPGKALQKKHQRIKSRN